MPATTIHTKAGAMVLNAITIQPGGSFGWHTHGAPVAVVVKSGTLTVFDPSVGGCKPFKVSKGKAFVEPAGHVHLARNDTKAPVTVYAMYLGLPEGRRRRTRRRPSRTAATPSTTFRCLAPRCQAPAAEGTRCTPR